MIVGIGIDILEISRIQKVWEKYPQSFMRYVLHTEERSFLYQIQHYSRQLEFIAGRFVLKEAYIKALGGGKELVFSQISIIGEFGKRPQLRAPFHHRLKVHLSLSHERKLVVGQVILEDIQNQSG